MSEEHLLELEDPGISYNDLLYKSEVYSVIGCCYEVHKQIGRGFSEAIYKDALALEFEMNEIPFEREKKFEVFYKGIKLSRHYICDFLVDDKIILEVKSQDSLIDANTGQLVNYLAVSGKKLGLLVNFGDKSLRFKRVIL